MDPNLGLILSACTASPGSPPRAATRRILNSLYTLEGPRSFWPHGSLFELYRDIQQLARDGAKPAILDSN